MEYSNLFVCLMGICTVFIGLVCIIALVSVMSVICTRTDKAMNKRAIPAPAAAPAAAPSSAVTPEMVAAVSAVIAEEMGTSVDAIRIVSMKKL